MNEGLDLALEWGEHFLQPIQERLAARHPYLDQASLDEINDACQAAMRIGKELVHGLAAKSGGGTNQEEFSRRMRAQIPWISRENLSRLYNQGMYFAWKDLGF